MNRLAVVAWETATVVGPNLGHPVVGPADLVAEATRTGLPDGAPPVTLAVSGGLLVWPWCVDAAGDLAPDATLTRPPVAVLDDVATAQDWLWALYGRDAALAVEAAADAPDLRATPGQEWLPAVAARFAFGRWLSAWWPASTTDGIPALDPDALRAELEPLIARLDLLLDGAEPPLPGVATARRTDRYALAAGTAQDGPPPAVGVSVSTGVGGTRWSDLPAGWVDASGRAVSWRLLQDVGHWSLRVRAAAGPVVATREARLVAEASGRRVELRPGSDSFGWCWLGEATGTELGPVPERVRVHLPGFSPPLGSQDADPPVRGARPSEASGGVDGQGEEPWQESARRLARARLTAVGSPPDRGPTVTRPWQAERAASADDDD